MKLKIYMLLTTVFMLLCAVCCQEWDDYHYADVQLADIELTNLDYSGRDLVKTDQAIKKEAYVIGVTYLIRDSTDHSILFPLAEGKYSITNDVKKVSVYCSADFAEYAVGSDISACFATERRKYGEKYHFLLVLKKIPLAGAYSFKVKFECSDSTIIEKESLPVTLF